MIGAAQQEQFSLIHHVIRLNESQASRMESRRPLTEIDTKSISLQKPAPKSVRDLNLKKSLSQLMLDGLSPDSTIIVNVRLGLPEFELVAPFRVHEIAVDPSDRQELVCEFAGADHFPGFPELRQGVRFGIPLDRVISLEFK